MISFDLLAWPVNAEFHLIYLQTRFRIIQEL